MRHSAPSNTIRWRSLDAVVKSTFGPDMRPTALLAGEGLFKMNGATCRPLTRAWSIVRSRQNSHAALLRKGLRCPLRKVLRAAKFVVGVSCACMLFSHRDFGCRGLSFGTSFRPPAAFGCLRELWSGSLLLAHFHHCSVAPGLGSDHPKAAGATPRHPSLLAA